MTQPTNRVTFAGVDASGDSRHDDLPNWYANKLGVSLYSHDALLDVVETLARATTVQAGYRDPERDEWIAVPRFVANVDPDLLGDALDSTTRTDAAWTFRSDSYTAVQPIEMYGPLRDAVRESDDVNGDAVCGEVRTYRRGGEVTLDVIFPDTRFGPEDEWALGLTSGYSHYGDTALWMEVIAVNTREGTEMRNLSDRFSRAHVGDAKSDVTAYWEQGIAAVEKASETLWRVIDDASQYEVDLDDLPIDAGDFYEAMDLPQYLANSAAQRLGDDATPSAWALYDALSAAITEDFEGKDGSALRKHSRRANKLLFSPPKTEREVLTYWQNELLDSDSQQTTLEGVGDDATDARDARQRLRERSRSLEDAVDTYVDRKAQMKRLVAEATNDEGDDDD